MALKYFLDRIGKGERNMRNNTLRKRFIFIGIAYLLSHILFCAPTATFQGKEKMLVLASEKDKCKLVTSQKQWTMLYGSSALNQIQIGQYSNEVPYKFIVRHTNTKIF